MTTTTTFERFTVRLEPDGTLVARVLSEMTAAEVLAAVAWQHAEADRLGIEAEPAAAMAKVLQETGTLPATTTGAEIEGHMAILQQASRAQSREARLLTMLKTAMPQWHEAPGMRLGDAVRRWWPR
jgi:hypothetical protein